MASKRTSFIVLVILGVVIENQCNIVIPQNYAMDNIKGAEHLLRGSNEERDEITEIPKNINEDQTIQNSNIAEFIHPDYEDERIALPMTHRDQGTQTYDRIPEELNPDKIMKSTTEEAVMMTFSVPEINTDNVVETKAYDASQLKHINSDVFRTTTELPESLTEYYTMPLVDSNVPKEIYTTISAVDRSDFIKTESSQTQAPTNVVMEEEITQIPRMADPIEEPSQRNPKTEAEKHVFEHRVPETKSSSTPSLSKSATVRGWLEDSWLRPPAGILVPLRPVALNRALAVWNDVIKEGLAVEDLVIVGYDSNGVNWRSRHNLLGGSAGAGHSAVAEALSKLLRKYQGVHNEEGDGTMRALATAAKLVPYDSALFVITDKGPGDPQRLPLALRALVEKRLKVYTIWTDPSYPSEESEKALQDLKNISKHTDGDVLPYVLKAMDVQHSNSAEVLKWPAMGTVPLRKARLNTQVDMGNQFDTLLIRRGGGGATSLGVPVENGVTALRVLIQGSVEHAVFYPPNDAPQIDLYNESSVRDFSADSRTESAPEAMTEGGKPREIYLVFPRVKYNKDALSVVPMADTTTSPVTLSGVWHLSIRCDKCDYNLSVSARSNIHFDTTDDIDMLSIRITGPLASVRESTLIDSYGNEIEKLPFSYQPIVGEGQETIGNESVTLMADVPLPTVKISPVYARIVGRDLQGEAFVRYSKALKPHSESRKRRSASISFPDAIDIMEREMEDSYLALPRQGYNIFYPQAETDVQPFQQAIGTNQVGFLGEGEMSSKTVVFPDDLEKLEDENFRNARLRYNESNIISRNRAAAQVVNQQGNLLTAVQIGLGTKLYGAPGDNLQLHFEVSNYRDETVRFNFGATGELRFLTGISPTSSNIAAGQTLNVIVSLTITASAAPGARDLITFTAYWGSTETVSIAAYVYVTNPNEAISDVWAPEMRHTFQGSCIGRLGDDCAQHVWTANIRARDNNAGLLRLSSSPMGLTYDSNFISGTREEVYATFRSTCCAPRVVITAVDALGNANSYIVDISGYLNEASIAAIALGVLLLIAIIALVVFLIYWCVKRTKESRELPTYTSSRNLN